MRWTETKIDGPNEATYRISLNIRSSDRTLLVFIQYRAFLEYGLILFCNTETVIIRAEEIND